MFKNRTARILLLIFLANYFYDDPSRFLIKRIVYSLFAYWAFFEMITYGYFLITRNALQAMPKWFHYYTPILFLYVFILLLRDLTNINLRFSTLLNNPFGLLSILPIFLFFFGANTIYIKPVKFLLAFISILFTINYFIAIPGKIIFYQGYIASGAIIPLIFLTLLESKNIYFSILLSIGLILLSISFVNISEYRIILLRMIVFFSITSLFLITNKLGIIVKFLIILGISISTFLLVSNLEFVLNLISGFINLTNFDAIDTRSFLYDELYTDLDWKEVIIGRGFLGTYFSEYFLNLIKDLDNSGDYFERFSIEVGFLELILKGGFILYVLYVFPIINLIYKGIFKYSKHRRIFIISIFLLSEIILMFFENIPYFNFQFSLIFFLAGYNYKLIKSVKNSVATSTNQNNKPSKNSFLLFRTVN